MQLRTSSFKSRVLGVVAEIPKGETRTYKQVAALAGSPNAYRAVGNIMSKNNNPKVPCHRVVKSDGTAGGYSGRGGRAGKVNILKKEGAI
ncbi:MAG: cysteine methyltransferase [Parcubacteria group bacterium GW2011_GWB1_45_7]|uniref:6-O-methylguanine DNA methyltransferase n=2 Tax=Candidatus Colwelliibacteriota TaxID=1817904 RepID=A0A1G1ZDQ2_9BACT|nr:MAG: cysteine methyltransferase [Parcubacteria group bacterium GW2011_GWB1_45_7]OGY58566.1 MAG: 6-O-methylguanine DNA methyltransferase [Candidatus Colwellbacteria bacterium RIFCSPHIGHO2_02_FULL_45_17]OGY61643.1 MAG: 6-O-methylguanine DNA methyltransferase [Candidatus Colwellbacteria bacterium RIFCSPLOWO2_02_FULL_45_11]OGY61867.1 MAG: 6-O-methylguanine DNA methyltransferase [Candidatus Colwellbacteria bacterium RIFCSPLOWO2_12_FULL_46_17]